MSMLTPPGAGARGRRSRRWPRVVGVLLVLVLVAAAGFAVWRYGGTSNEDASPSAKPTRTCSTPPVKLPRALPAPAEISLAVANGTSRAGLAVETADELVIRGFTVTSIGNTDKPVESGVAQVRYGRGDLPAAVVVASFFPASRLVEGKTSEIAVWLGPEFDGVVDADDADVDAVELPPGEPICRRQR